ncbi:MAG: hypothetical protein ACSHW0_18510 [Thalassotalea sp.]
MKSPFRSINTYVNLFFIFTIVGCSQQQKITKIVSEQQITQAAIKGKKSKIQKLSFKNNGPDITKITSAITGEHANFWRLQFSVPNGLAAGETIELNVVFQPQLDFIGIVSNSLILKLGSDKEIIYSLKGLSTKALEGKNEPPLTDVVRTLGYDINLGWTSLGNNTKPELQGDEIPPSLFKKSGHELVEMIPVARYSTPFLLPFGYYTLDKDGIKKFEVGVLADSHTYPEHQTLMPALSTGTTSFNPGNKLFGFYTTSPSHDSYSEDKWNALWFKKHVAHAVRIYEIKNESGVVINNQYLVCFEEAYNGDYQDYVFVLKNIKAIPVK